MPHGRGPGGLLYHVKGIMMRNHDGSGGTQDKRLSTLSDFIRTIYEKFKLQDVHQIRTTHVLHYVENLKTRAIDPHSMLCKMADVRWLAEKIGKANIVERENAAYDFPKDSRKLTTDQAWPDEKYREILAKIAPDAPLVALAMRGARHLGLRLEEASLVRPMDLAGHIVHLRRGTKGGRYRYVELKTPEARAWAQDLDRLAPSKTAGIIPLKYKLKSHVERTLREAGAGRKVGLRFHGLRHSFAQELYRKLAGCAPPIAGGKPDPAVHKQACKTIAKVLGHNRWKIAEMYVGGLE
jgi:integrase